jgi:hypothetical protein
MVPLFYPSCVVSSERMKWYGVLLLYVARPSLLLQWCVPLILEPQVQLATRADVALRRPWSLGDMNLWSAHTRDLPPKLENPHVRIIGSQDLLDLKIPWISDLQLELTM